MQKEYIQLGNKEVYNGQYMLCAFYVESYGGKTLEEASSNIAAESSNGSNLKVGTGTPFSASMGAIVYEIDHMTSTVYIAYPWRIFDRGGSVQNILTFIAGNVFGMSSVKACKLLDVQFPAEMLTQYDGPSYTLDDMRKYLDVYDSPILGSIIKPKIGLTSNQYAELCYDFWAGGGHFVKNDEPQADQDFAPFDTMVKAVRIAMDRAEDVTGHKKVHSFNVSAADFDTMIERADLIQRTMRPGSYAFLIDGITSGWTAVQTLRRRYPEVFLHFHRAGHGAFTRKESPFGFTVPVMTKFARLAGASGIHTGTAGIGKMDGSPEEDVVAAMHASRVGSQGSHFKQVWSTVSWSDSDVETILRSERHIWESGARELSIARRELSQMDDYSITHKADWRMMNKTAPIISGGVNPVLIPKLLDTFGTIDFITTMGGGTHSHPMGTTAGTQAVLESFRAWQNGQTLEEASHDGQGYDVELQRAVDFYNKKGTQATKVKQN